MADDSYLTPDLDSIDDLLDENPIMDNITRVSGGGRGKENLERLSRKGKWEEETGGANLGRGNWWGKPEKRKLVGQT